MMERVRDPIDNVQYDLSDTIDWKGTIGVGDFQMGLNACHMTAHLLGRPVTMNVHWAHDEDYLFHCEDPETIIERFDYLHSRYHRQEEVIVNHIFNSDDKDVFKYRWRGLDRVGRPRGTPIVGLNSWSFRPDTYRPVDNNKVVIWRPFANATPAPRWKKTFTEHDWYKIVEWYLKSKHKYNVVELDYRTTVREAFYHLSECRFFVCYDGMWHYVARNFCKPGVAVGDSGIIRYHDPQCVQFLKPDNYEALFKHKSVLEETLDKQCKPYHNKILKLIEQ